jgi:hypothetical protein
MRAFNQLRIHLSPSQAASVKRWLVTFKKCEENWAQYPYIEDGYLHISAMCFPFFLGYVNRGDSNEFDIERLRSHGAREIRSQISSQAASPNAGRYYRKALENLDFISVGEFLGEVGTLPSPF